MKKKKLSKDEKKEVRRGWYFLLAGLGVGLKLVLSGFDIEIPFNYVDKVVNVILWGAGAFGVWRFNAIGKMGMSQYRALRTTGIQHFFKKVIKDDE